MPEAPEPAPAQPDSAPLQAAAASDVAKRTSPRCWSPRRQPIAFRRCILRAQVAPTADPRGVAVRRLPRGYSHPRHWQARRCSIAAAGRPRVAARTALASNAIRQPVAPLLVEWHIYLQCSLGLVRR